MDKRFVSILLVVILAIGGVFWLTRDKNSSNGGQSTNNVQPTNHLFGENSAGVNLTEYGDYQCPACSAYYPIVKQVTEKYQAQIHFQFRNFPLSSIHPNAFAAARAAEAADKQGKFWEMNHALYEQQSSWSTLSSARTYFEQMAGQLGLDVAKFKTDYASEEINDLINADLKEAKALGADSTPTFVLNGKKVDPNPKDLSSFDKLIADAIAEKTKTTTPSSQQ